MWSHTTAQALELIISLRLVSDSQQSPCLNFLRVGITGTAVSGSFLSSTEGKVEVLKVHCKQQTLAVKPEGVACGFCMNMALGAGVLEQEIRIISG